jgi:O-acetyl-ADP-ribose deacetylase
MGNLEKRRSRDPTGIGCLDPRSRPRLARAPRLDLLRVADELACSSIALPAISTGIFGFPRDRAAQILFSVIEAYFTENPSSALVTIKLVLFDEPTVEVFLKIWHEKWGDRA